MAKNKNNDKSLDNEAISTESEVVEESIQTEITIEDESTDVIGTDEDSITKDDVQTDNKLAEDKIVNDVQESDEDSIDSSITDIDESTATLESNSDIVETEDSELIVNIERKVKSTNRVMKVYSNASEKSKSYSFVGTYVVTGVMKGTFKQIICNVPGIGKFTGYLLSR